MSLKVAQSLISLERFWHLYQKLPKNVGDLALIIVATDLEK